MADLLNIDVTSAGADLGDALSGVVGLVKFVLKDRNTPAFEAAFQNVIADWIIEERRQTATQVRRLAANSADVVALGRQLERLVEDPEFVRVSANFGYEACREAIDERRRMLAFASAGSLNLDLTIAQLARVERTIRELDPEDALLLATISEMKNPARPMPGIDAPLQGPKSDVPEEMLNEWKRSCHLMGNARLGVVEGKPTLAVLLASGCAYRFDGWDNDALEVTELGHRVTNVLRGYVVAVRGQEAQDG